MNQQIFKFKIQMESVSNKKNTWVQLTKITYMKIKTEFPYNSRTLPSLRRHILDGGPRVHIKDTMFSLNFDYCGFQL